MGVKEKVAGRSRQLLDTANGSETQVEIRESLAYDIGKRLFDLAVGSLILLLLLPIIPVIALMIKLDSPGPVFFMQTRVGKDGQSFQFRKFRSMHRQAERRRQ